MDPTERLFLHNPLHDYESIWWIAVWFVSHCELEGAANDELENARAGVYKNRYSAFTGNSFQRFCKKLPPSLLPLGPTLIWMKGTLLEAYKSFEETFDGSKMLSIAGDLKKGLKSLEEVARGVKAALPKTSPKRTRDGVDQVVEANEVPETGEEPLVGDAVGALSVGDTVEEPPAGIVMGSGDGESSQGDDLFGGSGGPAEPGVEKSKVLRLKRRLSPSSASHMSTSQPARIRVKLHDNDPEL